MGTKKINNLVEIPSRLKHNCNPEAMSRCSVTAYICQAAVEKTVCFSPRQRLQMASFYSIALPSLPLDMNDQNRTMPSFVHIGVFDFTFDWVALSVLSLCILSERLSTLFCFCSSAAAGGMEIKI